MLRTYIHSDEREWERLLPALELAHNTTSHSSTELSPFEVMIGENPLTAANLDTEADTAWPRIRDVAGNPTEDYEVDHIMDQRGSGDEAQYLVKWRWPPDDQVTWEPAHHLTGCQALLRAWHCRQRRRLQCRNNIGPSDA
ncbi:hypothetical protein ENH_00079090 [Eimeria necatrix]|uniref:Chromo domain-containing protein n=1 Tax=Eimeria necatrix TaxID=51315 RepID=U6MNT0_9EIME|nr:hypothetical protein ENH_00079090 [Eimeria necatrix]CDJ64728.1 hypothetical protein ENH_00079090 [Eimeria necatrix]